MEDHSRSVTHMQAKPQEVSCYSEKPQEWKMGMLAVLNKIALHYWRPDFEPSQFKHLMGDYLNDLAAYSPDDVEAACESFRRNPDNKFYPRVGELLAILKPKRDQFDKPSHLPKYSTPREMLYPQKPLPSVAEVLRKHGFERTADRWAGSKDE